MPSSELLELGWGWGEFFKQVMKEPVTAWLVRLWDMGTDGFSLTAVEEEKQQCNFSSLLTAKAA